LSLSKKHSAMIVAFFFIFFFTVQVFAQVPFFNSTDTNPLALEIALLRYLITNLSSPFSVYTEDPYSSYNPFSMPYVTIPNSPGYSLLPYPFSLASSASSDTFYKTYDVYNPVSFLNSWYTEPQINPLTSLTFEGASTLNPFSPFFFPSPFFMPFSGLFPF